MGVTMADLSMRPINPASTPPGPSSRKMPVPLVQEKAHRLGPADRAGDLGFERAPDLGGLGDCLGCDVGDDGTARSRHPGGSQFAREVFPGRSHESAVVGAGDIEAFGEADASGFRLLDCPGDAIGAAGKDDLSWGVEVGDIDVAVCGEFSHGGLVATDHCRHGAGGLFARFVHEPAAGGHESEAIGKRNRSGRRVRGELAERQSRTGSHLEAWDPLAEDGKTRKPMQIKCRLTIARARQCLGGPVSHDRREVGTENAGGLRKQAGCSRESLDEVAAHPDLLGALAGEQQNNRMAHFFTRVNRSGAALQTACSINSGARRIASSSGISGGVTAMVRSNAGRASSSTRPPMPTTGLDAGVRELGHPMWALAIECLRVETPFACDNEIRRRDRFVEFDQRGHHPEARDYSRATEREESEAKAARCAGAWRVGNRRREACSEGTQGTFKNLDLIGFHPFLWSEDARGAARSEQRVCDVAGGKNLDHLLGAGEPKTAEAAGGRRYRCRIVVVNSPGERQAIRAIRRQRPWEDSPSRLSPAHQADA